MNHRQSNSSKPGGPRIWTAMVLLLQVIGMDRCAMASDRHLPSLHANVPFDDFVHRGYHDQDGLPSSTIHDVLQTRDGYLWLATSNGVARFDGSRFTTFNRSNTPSLPSNSVETLCEGRNGTVWIGTAGGVAKYQPGWPGAFERVKDLEGIRTLAIFVTREGVVWVGGSGSPRYSRDGTHFEMVKDPPSGGVRDFCEDHHGTLWIATRFGLYRLTDGSLVKVESPHLADTPGTWTSPAEVTRIVANDDGTMWVGTSSGLFYFRDGVLEPRELQGRISRILRTRTGGLYLVAAAALHRLVDDSFERLTDFESIVCLTEDSEGGLWVGKVDNEGLHYYRNSRVRFHFRDLPVYCMWEDPQGRMWFGSDQGLHCSSADGTTDFGTAGGLPDATVRALAPGRGDVLWIGTARGLVKWSDGEFEPQVDPPELAGLNIANLHETRDGILWIGTVANGIYRMAEDKLQRLTDVYSNNNCFYEDAQGRLWIGTDSGLFRQNRKGFEPVRNVAFDQLGSSHFQCFHADNSGSLWIGTRGGLVRHRSGRFDVFTMRQGLASDYIERLHSDRHGNLWLGGAPGFFSVSKDDLESVAAGEMMRVRSDSLANHIQLAHWSVGSRGSPTSCLASDGTLWMSVGLGVVSMPAESPIAALTAPPVYIENARVESRTLDLDERLEFTSGRKRLAIEFAAPTFANPQHVAIQYRLVGHDENWIDAGSERIAYYTDLSPGDYQFRVRADNGYGKWNEPGASVGLAVLPRWWEITWLRVAAVFVTIIAGVSYFQYRMRTVRRANAALRREITERERAEADSRQHIDALARVARVASLGELTTSIAHEVKQPLFAIVSNAQTAQRLLEKQQPDVAEVRDALEDIADDGKRASSIIDQMRSLVKKEHHLTDQLNLNDVARDATRLAESEIRKRGLVIETGFARGLPLVQGDSIHLQQVILNLLINGVQAMSEFESGSRKLAVRTSAVNGSVKLAVEDHGSGLAEAEIGRMFQPFYTTKPEGIGIGLAISRTIIEAHGGRIWGTRNTDCGMTFHFSLPACRDTAP